MATSNLRFRIIGDDDASPAFLKVAAAARLTKTTFDDMGASALSLTKLVGGAGLIPVAAAASATLVELSVSAAAGGGALGIFGLSVFGVGKALHDARAKIVTTATKLDTLDKGSKEYRQTLKQLQEQQKAFNKEFGPAADGFFAMKVAFDQFQTATRDVTTSVMAKGFKLLADVLPRLAPISNAAGKAVGGLIDELSGWTKSNAFAGLIEWFRTSGPKAITHFGHIVGNVLDGLGGILANFVGPGDKAAAALEKLTKRFAVWGHSKGVSNSVDKFLKYVHDNGPQVASVFASLAKILPKLVSSMGGLGSVNLVVVSSFLKLLAGMPQGVFDVVVNGLFGILVATKALNIVMGINVLLTGMATALTVLGDAAIGTRIGLAALWVTEKVGAAVTKGLAAAQWLLNAAMTANPIGIVVVALAALAVGLVIAYKKSETFRNIVNGAFHAVQRAASAAFGWIKSHWKLLASILGGPIVAATILIISNWGKIKAGAANLWAAIKSGASKIKAYILLPFQLAKAGVSQVWQGMKQDASTFVGYIAAIPGRLRDLVGRFKDTGVALIHAFWAGVLSAANSAGGFIGDLVANIKAAINSALNLPLTVDFDKGPLHIHATLIPALAQGGIVNQPTLAMIGEAGPEAVIPLSGKNARGLGGGGDVYITVNASGLVDAPSMAKAIEKELTKLKSTRGGASLGFV